MRSNFVFRTVKGGTSYPISVKKAIRGQQICMENFLPAVNLVDSGGAFLPLQSEIFPDKNHGGRNFYNIARASQLGIPQLSVVCGSCTAGGAYTPTMCDESKFLFSAFLQKHEYLQWFSLIRWEQCSWVVLH